jgi:hypothetical protein
MQHPSSFCDPKSPTQRGSNENTSALPGRYFPGGMDLSNVHQNRLNAVARQLYERLPRTPNLEHRLNGSTEVLRLPIEVTVKSRQRDSPEWFEVSGTCATANNKRSTLACCDCVYPCERSNHTSAAQRVLGIILPAAGSPRLWSARRAAACHPARGRDIRHARHGGRARLERRRRSTKRHDKRGTTGP